jgi:hypothetical protein
LLRQLTEGVHDPHRTVAAAPELSFEVETFAAGRGSVGLKHTTRRGAGGVWEHAALRLSYFGLYSAVT